MIFFLFVLQDFRRLPECRERYLQASLLKYVYFNISTPVFTDPGWSVTDVTHSAPLSRNTDNDTFRRFNALHAGGALFCLLRPAKLPS